MRIRDVMSRDVQVARPGDSLKDVSARMAAGDFGFMPVADGDRLVGTVTDRDVVVRGVATGVSCDSPVSGVMTSNVQTCRDDEDLKAVLDLMASRQIRRLPIVDKNDRLVGVVSLGDLSVKVKERYAGEALETISKSATPT